MTWQLTYLEPIYLYLERMGMYGTKLRAALDGLSDGQTPPDAIPQGDGIFYWEAARHRVVYFKLDDPFVDDETGEAFAGRIFIVAIRGDRI